MDQDKIGKLIAKLRKEKGLTQRELGEKVGVGFKAVSKWERGITCPDISIINELSKILGITSDELLTGKLNPNHTSNGKVLKHTSKKILLIVAIICFIGAIFFIIRKINNDRVEVYNLDSASAEYYVEGKIIFRDDRLSIYINNVNFNDKEFNNLMIKDYKYKIDCMDYNLVNIGLFSSINELYNLISIRDFSNSFSVYYDDVIKTVPKKKIIINGIVLSITFIDVDDNLVYKEISIKLNKSK